MNCASNGNNVTGDVPLTLRAITTKNTLHMPGRDDKVMARQLDRLLYQAEQTNATFQGATHARASLHNRSLA